MTQKLILITYCLLSLVCYCISTVDKCDDYKDLYPRLDSLVAYWTREGKVLQTENLCLAHKVKIYNNKLYFYGFPMLSEIDIRIETGMILLNQALRDSPLHLPNVEFSMNGNSDFPIKSDRCPAWSLCEEKGRFSQGPNFVYPDTLMYHGYYAGHAEWTVIMDRIEAYEKLGNPKIEKALWRGTVMTQSRAELVEAAKLVRPGLADVVTIGFNGKKDDNYIPAEDWCRYKYLIYSEGRSYSMRIKHMLLCKSIIITNEVKYLDFAMEAIRPDDMVFVDKNWRNLGAVLEKLEKNSTLELRQAVGRAERFKRLLSPAGISCFLRRQIMAHASILAYTVEPPNGSWTSFDTYLLMALKHASRTNISETAYFAG